MCCNFTLIYLIFGFIFLAKVDGSLIHFAFSLDPSTSFETDNPSSKLDDCFWCPIKVLIPIDVRMPFISSWFIRFSVAMVPWLQVSNNAKVMISLLDSLCWTLTGTTHILRTWPEKIAAHWVLLILAQLLLIISDVSLSSDELSSFLFNLKPWRQVGCSPAYILQILRIGQLRAVCDCDIFS